MCRNFHLIPIFERKFLQLINKSSTLYMLLYSFRLTFILFSNEGCERLHGTTEKASTRY